MTVNIPELREHMNSTAHSVGCPERENMVTALDELETSRKRIAELEYEHDADGKLIAYQESELSSLRSKPTGIMTPVPELPEGTTFTVIETKTATFIYIPTK